MALTLTPIAFANSQDSQSRHPLVEILSQNSVPDIPFDGQFLTSETVNEQRPNVIYHTSGRLIQIYTFGTAAFKYVYTDVDRTQFYSVTITPGTGFTAVEASLCELVNGNIGIIYIADYTGGVHKLRRLVLSPIGEIVSADTEIASYASANILGSPFVIRLASGTFLLVYTKVDSPNYKIMMRTGTTANFLTWSAESLISISGLTSTRKRYNTHLAQVVGGGDAGKIFLWFDYEDAVSGDLKRYNIFYSISSNDGVDWGTKQQVTTYTTYGAVGKHPVAAQKTTNQMTMAYTEQRGALQMDKDTLGVCFDVLQPTDMSLDTINRKLYVLSTYPTAGTKRLYGVLKIDIDTWTIDDCWGAASVPAFNAAFFNNHIWWDRHHGDQYLMPVGLLGDYPVVAVVDGEANTITNYVFKDQSTYGLVKNVDLVLNAYEGLFCTWIDFASRKLWCLFVEAIGTPRTIRVGWIDLTEVINPSDPASLYHWNNVIFDSTNWTEMELYANPNLLILPDQDFIVVSFGHEFTGATYPGHLKVYHMGDGGIYRDYKHSSNESFPYHGLRRVTCKNGKLYGGFTYEADLGEVDKRGLCEIDIASDAMVLHRPSWVTTDDYKLRNLCPTNDGRLIITTGFSGDGYGITIYDIASDTWLTPFTNITLPGLSPGNLEEKYGPILYDEATGLIFTGPVWSITGSWKGLICFSEYGYIRRAYKMEGTYSGGIWTFAAATQLVQGLTDYDLVMALDSDESIYAFWTNQALTELSIKWDKESSEFDISKYLIRESELVVSRTINGDPASLEFEASHGHLFDPHNFNSLLAIYLKKFRKLNLRFGEKVGINEYWQQCGVFFVKQVGPVNYERPQYPTIKIVAEDNLGMWEFANVVATEYYSIYPKDILLDLIPDTTNLEFGDLIVPDFDGSVILYYQWVETVVKNIIHQICERFGYYERIDVNGKFTAKKISEDNPIDHIYADLTKIIRFSPDDSYSDYTNRIVIIGEGRDWLEVLYNEEPVGQSANGTLGWWVNHEDIEVWYSSDHSRRCRYPRMEVVDSVEAGTYFMKNGTEYISSIRSDELGFTVHIEGPDMRKVFYQALSIYIIFMIVCYILNAFTSIGGGLALVCFLASLFAYYNLTTVMATQGTYSYNFYAQPVGKVRQSFQANADDLALQNEIGMVVEKKFEDPLCYTLAHCQSVADFEMMVTKLQRNRVTFEKLADLRDEDGDIVQILHPFSGQSMRILITDLKRKFKIPQTPGDNSGYFIDEIEGWVIN